jgi:hypothetical protein
MIVYLMNDLTILLVLWYQRFAKIIMAKYANLVKYNLILVADYCE